MSTVGKFVSSLVLFAVIGGASFATPSAAVAAEPSEQQLALFNEYSMNGWIMGYYGYVYCDYARFIAVANGYDDGETSGTFYYAQQYALYSYIYGYYGWEYGYSEWVTQAGDLAVAARNFEKGIYDYLYDSYYQQYPNQLQEIMDVMLYGYSFEEWADVYYDYAVGFVAVE